MQWHAYFGAYTFFAFTGRSASVLRDGGVFCVICHIMSRKIQSLNLTHFVTLSLPHLQISQAVNAKKVYAQKYACNYMLHEIFWGFRMKFQVLSQTLIRNTDLTTPAIFLQLILMTRSLSVNFRPLRIIIYGIPKNAGRIRLRIKITKMKFSFYVQIQTRCTVTQ